jgi:hypothetical protein
MIFPKIMICGNVPVTIFVTGGQLENGRHGGTTIVGRPFSGSWFLIKFTFFLFRFQRSG